MTGPLAPAARAYAALFLEENLGLVRGALGADDVPSEFAESLSEAMRGSEAAESSEPTLDLRAQRLVSELEGTLLDRDGFTLTKERWPHAAPYAACLTHDVDNVSRSRGHLVEVRRRFSRSDFILALLGLKSVYNNISYVAEQEGQRKLHSSFYLLSSNYDLRPLAPTLRTLRERGWEVGLHGDFGTHDSEPKMAEATERLRIATGARPKGVREHFLRFDYDVSWGIMDRQGFVYDSSVGNRERIGFRLGLCNPFHPPGPDWTPLRVLEVPLVLMDTTLWGYLKRDEEAGKRDITDLRRKVSSADGLFTVLWHQEAARMRGGRLYPWLLDELLKDGCYVGSGDEIAAWWRSRAGPMLREGSVLRMENCPGGLTLRFKTKEERKLSVQGGKAETRANEAIIRVDPGNFRMEVD